MGWKSTSPIFNLFFFRERFFLGGGDGSFLSRDDVTWEGCGTLPKTVTYKTHQNYKKQGKEISVQWFLMNIEIEIIKLRPRLFL